MVSSKWAKGQALNSEEQAVFNDINDRLSMLARGEIDDDEFVMRLSKLMSMVGMRTKRDSEDPGAHEDEPMRSPEEEISMSQLEDKLANLIGEYNQQVERIRSDERLADTYKQQQLTQLYQDYTNRHQQMVQSARDTTERRVAEAERRILSPRFPEGLYSKAEEETFLMSYRDAVSRVEAALEKAERAGEGLDDPKERLQARREAGEKALQGLLSQADMSGDETLAQAIYHHAARGKDGHDVYGPVREAYLSARPSEQRAWERLVAAQKEQQELMSHGTLLARTMSTPQRPQEVNPLTAMGPVEAVVVDPKAATRQHLRGLQ